MFKNLIVILLSNFLSLFFINLNYADETIKLLKIASGLNQPISIKNAGDGTNRLFIIEQSGRIMIIDNGKLLEEPFLNLEDVVFLDFEAGLLDIEFHPQYKDNQRFFVSYTIRPRDAFETIFAEYKVSDQNPNVANDEGSIFLQIPKHAIFHHGGQLQFGPDGFLYISVGDGALSNNNAQENRSFFGSLLRIDMDSGFPYSVPPDNPFVGNRFDKPEIWAHGFRNPWRFSFDKPTGRIFLGDVGQSCFEEINLIEKGGNYGWPIVEGERCFEHSDTQFECEEDLVDCDDSGLTKPILTYSRSIGSVVIAGYVYHGNNIPELVNSFIFGDFGHSKIFSLDETPAGNWEQKKLLRTDFKITAFGEDEESELYVCDYTNGKIFKIVSAIENSETPIPTNSPNITPTPTLAIATPTSTPTATPVPSPTPNNKLFAINCESELHKSAHNITTLDMKLGQKESCTFKTTELQPNNIVTVYTKRNADLQSSVKISPLRGIADDNGELKFTITATEKGSDWIAWAVQNSEGKHEFSKEAYNNGTAWGMFVNVK